MAYQVEKLLQGYSICFRQWEAKHSHCQFLHGYAVSFKLTFESEVLDRCHWVWDFGWLKNSDYRIDGVLAKSWFSYMFDHTVLVAETDPNLEDFKVLNEKGIIQLRVLPSQSCEGMAKYVFDKVSPLIQEASDHRVKLVKVSVYEHERNSASYIHINT